MILLEPFIPDSLRLTIRDWMLERADSLPEWGNPRTKWFRPWWRGEDPLPEFFELKELLMQRFHLNGNHDRRRYTQLSIIFDGGYVHDHDHMYVQQHDEEYYREYVDCRINTMIQSPKAGAALRVNNVTFDPPETGESWTFDAFQKHGVHSVIGDTPRIVASFGFHMPKSEYRSFCEGISA